MLRFLVSIHKKKGSGFEKITEKFGPIWRICQLKPLWGIAGLILALKTGSDEDLRNKIRKRLDEENLS